MVCRRTLLKLDLIIRPSRKDSPEEEREETREGGREEGIDAQLNASIASVTTNRPG